MAEKRRMIHRQPRRVRVLYGIEEGADEGFASHASSIGYTSNVSRLGMRLEGRRRYLASTRIWLQIGDSGIRLWGTVMWVRVMPVQFVNAGYMHSMGIKFDLTSAHAVQSAPPPRAQEDSAPRMKAAA